MPRPKNNVLHNLFLTNGENEVYCNNDNCQNKTLTKHTGNLERHLKIYHPILYADYIQKKLKTFDMRQRKMNPYNISESSVDRTSESCSDQELEYFPLTKLSKIKVENVEEFLTQCMDAPTTEDTSKSEFMDAPSSSTYVGAAEDPIRTNDEHTYVPSSSIRVLDNSANSIAKASITEELFGCLAKKVNEANLTAQQINDIEHSVCLLVYSRLAKYNKDCYNSVNN